MIELSPAQIVSLYHPYYLSTFRKDDITIERYVIIEPHKKAVATIQIHQLAFDENIKQLSYVSGLLATRCLHQVGFMYLAWAYDKSKIAFVPRSFSIQFKKHITNRIFAVVLNMKCRESKSGRIMFEVTADFDDGKLIATATLFGFPTTNESPYSSEFMLMRE